MDMTALKDMTPEQKKQAWYARFLEVARGDVDAADYLMMFFLVVHLWDDLIDGDKPRSDADINKAFFCLMVEIPRNPFFMRHQSFLVDITQVYINQWLDANRLETMGRNGLERAFALRDTTGDMLAQVAYIVGGFDWMRAVAETEYKSTFSYETFADYAKDRGLDV